VFLALSPHVSDSSLLVVDGDREKFVDVDGVGNPPGQWIALGDSPLALGAAFLTKARIFSIQVYRSGLNSIGC
jgi:hypothetical protein